MRMYMYKAQLRIDVKRLADRWHIRVPTDTVKSRPGSNRNRITLPSRIIGTIGLRLLLPTRGCGLVAEGRGGKSVNARGWGRYQRTFTECPEVSHHKMPEGKGWNIVAEPPVVHLRPFVDNARTRMMAPAVAPA